MLTGFYQRRYNEDKIRLIEDNIKIKDWFRFNNTNEIVLTDIRLTEQQKTMIRAIETGKNVVVKKSRQCGATTAIASFLAGFLYLNSNKKCVILCQYMNMSEEVMNQVRDFINQINYKINGNIKYEECNRKRMRLSNGSLLVLASPNSRESLIGTQFNLIVYDECAFTRDLHNLYELLMTTQQSQHIFISTPNYDPVIGKPFKDFYSLSEHSSDWETVDMFWYNDPRYVQGGLSFNICEGKKVSEWYLSMKEKLKEYPEKITTELDACFL